MSEQGVEQLKKSAGQSENSNNEKQSNDSLKYNYNSCKVSDYTGNKMPYSFGDPKQLPSMKSTSQQGKTLTANNYSPLISKQTGYDLAHEFDPILCENRMQRTQCPIYCNAWSHDELDAFHGGFRYFDGVEAEFQTIQPPTDYASQFAKDTGHTNENPVHTSGDCVKNDYMLWPIRQTDETVRLSPTKLQKILMGRDVKSSCKKETKIRSSEKRTRMQGGTDEAKKRKFEDDRINTPVIQAKKTNSKAMHCVRRLFPANTVTDCLPEDSESDSEFCRNLSQDSSSQSESSDWAVPLL